MLPENLASIDDNPPTRFWQKISLVAEISHLCRRHLPDSPTYNRVLEHIQKIVPFDVATLHLRIDDTPTFQTAASLGDPVAIPGFLITTDDVSGSGRLSEQPMLLTRRDDTAEPHAEYGALLYVPLIADGQALGAMVLASVPKHALTEQHLKLMSIVADQLAVSIERLNYVATIETKNEELRLTQEELRANQKKIVAAEKLAEAARMAASVNHQINNPLAVILGHVQCLLMEQRDLGAKTLQRLSRIEQAAERIATVNRCLLRINDSHTAEHGHGVDLSILETHMDEVGVNES